MGLIGIAGEVLAPHTAPATPPAALAVWWGREHITATGTAGQVTFDGWPVLPTGDDTSMWEAIIAAANLGKGATVAAALPWTWGPARRAAWHRTAEDQGLTIRAVPAPDVLDRAIGDAYGPLLGIWAVIDGVEHPSAVILSINTGHPPEVLGQAEGRADLPGLVADTARATDLDRSPTTIAVIGDPSRTRERQALQEACGVPVRTIAITTLAATVAAIDAATHPPSPAPARPHRASIASTSAALLLSVALLASVITDATPYAFSPGHLALGATALATAVIGIGMIAVHTRLADTGAWDWATAGRWLTAATLAALIATGACGLALAAVTGVPAGSPLAWSVLPAAPALACYAAIGHRLTTRPDPPPQRRIWPPMAAIALGVAGILLVRAVEPIFTGMPLGDALLARAGLMATAAATGMVLTTRPATATGIAAALFIVYTTTASPSTGTTACLLLTTALAVRTAAALTAIITDHHPAPGRPATSP